MEKELKVGSVLMDSNTGRLGRVEKFIHNRIKCKMEKSTLTQHREDYQQAPLNWYALAKLGFKHLEETSQYEYYTTIQEGHGVAHDFTLHISLMPNHKPEVFIMSEGKENLYCNIEYAHQLQNLWQSITGHELEFKHA